MRLRPKGRHWLLLWLLVFLAGAILVVTRQTTALQTARRVYQLRVERGGLEARRAELERRIRLASSRQVLVPMAERAFGLHEPADSEFVLFPMPQGPDPVRP